MASTFSLLGKLGLDSKDFVSGAKKAEQAIGDVADEMDDLPSKGGDAGSKAGGLLSSNLAKGFAMAGGAAALAAGFKSVIDAASNLEESTNAVNVAFGDAGAAVLAFGENSAEPTACRSPSSTRRRSGSRRSLKRSPVPVVTPLSLGNTDCPVDRLCVGDEHGCSAGGGGVPVCPVR